MKKALIFLSLSVFLFGFGCASHRHITQKELSKEAAKYVRKKTDELLLKKGPPDLKAILSTGEQLWKYCSTKAGEQKSLTMTIGNAPSNINALDLITLNGIAPHPIPLPSGERGG